MENFPSKPQIHANTLISFFKSLGLFLVLLFSLFFIQSLNAQTNPKAEKEFKKALDYLNNGKDDKAIEFLNKSLSIDDKYPDALLCMAEIYFNQSYELDSTKLLAFPYYKKFVEVNPDYDITAHTRLAEFYLLEYNTEKAKYHFNYALSKFKSPKDNKKMFVVNKKLEQITFMEYALNNPVDFRPENMGGKINNEFDQYLPTLTADEQTFIFTSLIPDT